MRVVDLWRYPVKSLQGERLDRAEVDEGGLVGDRGWALADPSSGTVLTARRAPDLLFGSGRLAQDAGAAHGVVVTDGDGRVLADDEARSAWLGRDVRLERAGSGAAPTYECPVDEEEQEWVRWDGPTSAFHDSTRTQVSIVATGDLGDWEVRRFRPNLVVDGDTADVLLGRTVRVGGVTLEVVKQIDRCVMVTRPQPGGIERDLDVLRTVNRERSTFLGVGALVRTPGPVAVGDELVVD